MSTLRILIADDHQLVRAGLKLLLTSSELDVDVVAEASNGLEALAACAALQPDLVLMDIAMPQMSGLDALQQLKVSHPNIRVLILSMFANEEHVIRALRLGAAGYLLKDSAPAELELAVRAMMRGETWLSSPISQQVVDGYLDRTNPTPLTERQTEVLRLLAEGHSVKEIAFQLSLSIKTIETFRTQIMERLDVHDLAGLIRYAIRRGISSLD
jgi:DNA-binding NarL/FixJ family response regulator